MVIQVIPTILFLFILFFSPGSHLPFIGYFQQDFFSIARFFHVEIIYDEEKFKSIDVFEKANLAIEMYQCYKDIDINDLWRVTPLFPGLEECEKQCEIISNLTDEYQRNLRLSYEYLHYEKQYLEDYRNALDRQFSTIARASEFWYWAKQYNEEHSGDTKLYCLYRASRSVDRKDWMNGRWPYAINVLSE